MSTGKDDSQDLDGEDSAILNMRGWFLVTYFQCRKDVKACESRNRAIEKAKSINRPTGIRVVEKQNHVIFEVWENWK